MLNTKLLNFQEKRKNLWSTGIGKELWNLDFTPKAQPIEREVEKLDFIKIKIVCSAKNYMKKMKR